MVNKLGNVRMSGLSMKRMLWVGDACEALLDYRNPGHVITTEERRGLAEYQDLGYNPSDAADAYQAKTGK
jgi:putative alpha-1,2-mannosidase